MVTEALIAPGLLDGTTPMFSTPQVFDSHYQIAEDSGQLVGPWIEPTVLELTTKISAGQLEIFPGTDQIQPLSCVTIQIFPELA